MVWPALSMNDIVRRTRRYLTLSRADQRLLLSAYVSLALVEVGLRTLGFRRLIAWVPEVGQPPQSVEPATLRWAMESAYWLEVASRHSLIRAQCLHRAIALHYWLRRAHLPSMLRIGVRKEGAALAAHAWVELYGQPLQDHASSVEAFTPLPVLDGGRRIYAA